MTTLTTKQDREILAAYAGGRTVTEITAAGHPKKLATDLVADVAKFDRGRARQAVLEFDQRNGASPRPVSGPPARPAPIPEADDEEQIDTVTDLLDAAEQTEVPRIVKAAGRIREQIAELQAAVAAVAKQQRLRAEVEQLRAAYEKAQAELRQVAGGPARVGAAPRGRSGLPTKEIRAWAVESGVECSTHGRVPEAVVEQWRAATGLPTP